MCGIFGVWHLDGRPVDATAVRRATETIRHRGPDDEGYLWVDTGSGTITESSLPGARSSTLAFGFRRLSIIDLSPAGHQPMCSADGTLWIVFNGEIYNYRDLRKTLSARGYSFQSASDTEVILYAYAEWGEACVEQFNGMWAFALWDNHRRRLFCARDRFGIKPFYYLWNGRSFLFASEIKALIHFPDVSWRPNAEIIYDYLSSGLLDHREETFFADVRQLRPAHTLSLNLDGQLHLRRYWDLDPERYLSLPTDDTYAQAFRDLFEDAIRLHLQSDVAVGTCLSGGLDSSSIVCVANKLLFSDHILGPELVGQRQKTFSSCFNDRRFDERPYIDHVLQATCAESNLIFPSPDKLQADLERLVWHQDEPFGSTSIFAQWCVMERVAECGVKVLLDGQGADELLAGYQSYFRYYWASLARRRQWAALWREWVSYRRMFNVSRTHWVAKLARPIFPSRLLRVARRLRRPHSNGGVLGLSEQFQREQRGHRSEVDRPSNDPFYNFLYDAFTRSSLPALLHYEDRNSMAHSIEARVPFLDYRLVEFIFSLPADQKIRRALTKTVLRHAMRGILPEPVRMRTDKMGFVTPERVWISTTLRSWIRDIVHSSSFRTRGYLDADAIQGALDQHDAGQRDLTFVAWRWVNLELWFRQHARASIT